MKKLIFLLLGATAGFIFSGFVNQNAFGNNALILSIISAVFGGIFGSAFAGKEINHKN